MYVCMYNNTIFTRVSICYSAYNAISRQSVRPSVCPSVCPSVTRVDHTKTVEVRIMKFSPYGSPIPLVFREQFHPEILRGSTGAVAFKEGGVGKIGDFRTLSRHISETVQDRTKVAIDH